MARAHHGPAFTAKLSSMCGIAGILRTWQPGETPPAHLDAIPEAWLDILDDSIKHRGPDGEGRFRHRVTRPDGTVVDVALVHRRLSIIDHATGAQPMVLGSPPISNAGLQPGVRPPVAAGTPVSPPNEFGGSEGHPLISREGSPYAPLPTDHHTCPKCGPGVVAVAFNGCIYNHRELRRELEAAGHVFSSDHSDTEVLLHGWREWCPKRALGELLEHFEGMFSLALWDAQHGDLYLGRDEFGEKPMYWSFIRQTGGSTVAFASVPSALLQLQTQTAGPIGRRPNDLNRWIRFGYGWSPPAGPQAAGFLNWVRLDQQPIRKRYTPDWRRSAEERLSDNHDQNVELTDLLVREAVKGRLEADVPVGAFLSGGVDSSLIALYAQNETQGIDTFTVRMPDPRYDESTEAARVAAIIGTRHHTLEVDADPSRDLVSLITQLGLPFGDSSLLPALWVSRASREVTRVALSGDGGDELFGGYERYAAMRILSKYGRLIKHLPHNLLAQRSPRSRWTKLARLIEAARSDGYRDLTSIFPHALMAILTPGCPAHEYGFLATTPGGAMLDDRVSYLPDDLLRKTDTASMSAALEVRCPFLDPNLWHAISGADDRVLMPNGQRKGLLRAVARKYLPPEIVDRPKMGFAIPVGEWFRSDYGGMRQLLYDHLESADPFPGLAESGVEINMGFVQQMLREHDAAGERSINPWHGRDHSQRLYMLVVLSIWCRWLKSL